MKFRRKPKIVEALQWDGINSKEIEEFLKSRENELDTISVKEELGDDGKVLYLSIMIVPYKQYVSHYLTLDVGDYVMKGDCGTINGYSSHFFERLYESMEEGER